MDLGSVTDAVTVTGAATLSPTLIVNGPSTSSGAASLADTAVTGSATLQSTLDVTGAATFDDDVILGDLSTDTITIYDSLVSVTVTGTSSCCRGQRGCVLHSSAPSDRRLARTSGVTQC